MLFRFGKKKKQVSRPLESKELLRLLAADKLPCRRCGATCPTKGVSILESITCACGNSSLVKPCKLSSFYLYEFIDHGGMGIVYRAVSPEYPGEDFAVKLLHADKCDDLSIDALMNEARNLRKFEGHPHIVQAVEVGEVDGAYFFVSELIEGQRLDRYVEYAGQLPPAEAVDLILELLRIDKYVWTLGFLYRDLKPENILLKDGRCKLIDFGLCIGLSDAHSPRTAEIEGAPHFMPPERLTGEPEGVYSETYSLGMILYYCLLGRTLFPSGDAQEVAEQYLHGDRSAPELQDVGHQSEQHHPQSHRPTNSRSLPILRPLGKRSQAMPKGAVARAFVASPPPRLEHPKSPFSQEKLKNTIG